jgi:lantibiotic transport system ATP-binding protein
MEECVIETHGLTRRFGRLAAVDGIDLTVPRGCVYGFLGPNGAGKTTTIRLLLGLIRPSAGEVRLLNQPPGKNRSAQLARIGSLVETPALYPHLTGRENLRLIAVLRGYGDAQIERSLAIVKLEGAAGRLAGQYSLGMRQRLGLAIALMGMPDLLILDEPTNGLDPAGIHEVRTMVRHLASEYGVTMFISSHLLSEVEQMADQVGIIQAGRLVFQGTPEGLRAQYQDHVALGVDQPELARALLARNGWQVSRNGATAGSLSNGYLRVAANGQADAGLLATQLVQAGLRVHHVSLEQPSLEDVFLQLTQTGLPEPVSPVREGAFA